MILRDDKGELIDCWEAKWDPIRKVFDGYVDESEQRQSAAKQRPTKEGRFTKHIWPTALVKDLCFRGGHAHLCIVRYLHERWFKEYRKPDPITVRNVPVNDGKAMNKRVKNRVLSDLGKWGWIEIERKKGCVSRVTIKWRSPE